MRSFSHAVQIHNICGYIEDLVLLFLVLSISEEIKIFSFFFFFNKKKNKCFTDLISWSKLFYLKWKRLKDKQNLPKCVFRFILLLKIITLSLWFSFFLVVCLHISNTHTDQNKKTEGWSWVSFLHCSVICDLWISNMLSRENCSGSRESKSVQLNNADAIQKTDLSLVPSKLIPLQSFTTYNYLNIKTSPM